MIRIATRGSKLALTQAGMVAEMLGGAELVEASSDGEQGDKSRFVRGVERVVMAGEAEVGVHAAKDLPGEMPTELEIAAVPAREDPADVWIGAGSSLADAPEGARVGTASLPPRAHPLAAVLLAAAALRRVGREAEIGFRIPAETMVPAPGQGTLVLQVRAGDEETIAAVAGMFDLDAARQLTAERAAARRRAA